MLGRLRTVREVRPQRVYYSNRWHDLSLLRQGIAKGLEIMPLGEHVAARIAEDSKMELLRNPLPIIVLIFVVSSMLAVGVSLTVGQILVPLRNLKLISLALLANFVLITLAALAIARLLRLNQSLSIGLILVSTAAGSPFLLKLATSGGIST
jgi:predicted Na+-dependent transporter